MRAYRVYGLDDDGLVVCARLFEAKGDDEANGAALELGWARWQLWTNARLVSDHSRDQNYSDSHSTHAYNGLGYSGNLIPQTPLCSK